MQLKSGILLFIFFILSLIGNAQDYGSASEDSLPAEQTTTFRPTIALGTGMFSFYGDISEKTYKSPLISRIGYDLTVGKKLTSFLEINFYALFGKLGANERSVNRNLNFESEIRAGGMVLLYDFDHLLKPGRIISPYISAGAESFEFLSKTDLSDAKGRYYYYWDNGAIKDRPQNSPDAANAIDLQRDYVYETDIRERNADGFGKYPERSLAIPVGAGVKMHLSDRVNFKLGATMHFTFTDYVDGITGSSTDNRTGNSKNDRFLMTSGSLSYDFMPKPKPKAPKTFEPEEDLLAYDLGDYDKDGVRDFDDMCAGTPVGVKVDEKGCPLDEDLDLVPNYRDDELMTRAGVFVTPEGVELTDSLILLQYQMYMDSTGEFARIIKTKYGDDAIAREGTTKYTVQLGAFTKGIPPALINKFLSVPDITTTTVNDSVTVYTAGTYTNRLEAERRKNALVNAGLENVTVVESVKGGFRPTAAVTSAITPVGTKETEIKEAAADNNPAVTDTTTDQQAEETTEAISDNNETDTSYTDEDTGDAVVTGEETAKETTGDATEETIGDATEETTGDKTEEITKDKTISESDKEIAVNQPDEVPANVIFRIQLGAYSKKLSRNIFSSINDLVVVTTEDGLVKYLTGSYTDYNEVAKRKIDLLLQGFNGAFIVAYKNGKRVPLESVGATRAGTDEVTEEEDAAASSSIDKNLIRFKVQLGAFRNEPPAEVKSKLSAVSGVEKQLTSAGIMRYTAGSFNNYKQAEALKNQLINQGFPDAFIVSFFKDELIPVQEALELLEN